MDEPTLQLTLLRHVNELMGLALLMILAIGVIKYKNFFVAWIIIVATLRVALNDHGIVEFVLGNTIAIMLTFLIYRYMRLVVVYAKLSRGADIAALKHAVDTAIVATDTEGVVVSWDKASERLFGRAADKAIGKKLEDMFYDGSKLSVRRLLKCALEGTECIEHLDLARHDSHERVPVQLVSKPAIKDDRIIGMLLQARKDRRGHAKKDSRLDR